MSPELTLKIIANMQKELAELEQNYRYAASVQWQRSPGSSTSSSEVRARGGHNDSVGDTAVDPRRLGVRRAVNNCGRDLERLYVQLRSINGSVGHAARRWDGLA